MGHIQRRGSSPQHGGDSPFQYLDLRSRVEHERVAERHYDERGNLRAERFGTKETTTYRPYPNLRQRPTRTRGELEAAAVDAADRLGAALLYLFLLGGWLCVTSLAFTIAGWWGAGAIMVITAIGLAGEGK